jgi:hypothetical protein
VAAAAGARFLKLRSFSGTTLSQLLEDRNRVRLKHALAVIALEAGRESWRDLKARAEGDSRAVARPAARSGGNLMYERAFDALLNRWFARYQEARDSLERLGGFLLPYERQFVVCEAEAIRELGLDPEDSDWERIGWDWVEPGDRDAWQRLKEKRLRVLEAERPW